MGFQSELNQEQKRTDEIKSSVDEVYTKTEFRSITDGNPEVNSVNSGAKMNRGLWAKCSNQLDYDICGFRDTWVYEVMRKCR